MKRRCRKLQYGYQIPHHLANRIGALIYTVALVATLYLPYSYLSGH